ncbi:hypothetical protein LJC33_05285 [Eubacteriales bacterium OttesenSCG-928-N13]|nr:hypothetical protein [Eubacteriales bacterium OttesenSCG-928-N13]
MEGTILAQRYRGDMLYLQYVPDLRPGSRLLLNCLASSEEQLRVALLISNGRRAIVISVPTYSIQSGFEQYMMRFFHDEKMPLMQMMENVRILNETLIGISPALHRKLDRASAQITENCERMVRLFGYLAENSATAMQMHSIHYQPCEMVWHVRNVCAQSMNLAMRSGIQLHFRSNVSDLLTTVDPEMIERIVMNLLSNAFKHTSSGGLVRAEVNRLNDTHFQIAVTDTGCGIPPEQLKYIFRRYHTVPGDATAGNGLGLSNVQLMTNMHGGKVLCQSAPGKGARFEINLPIMPQRQKAARPKARSVAHQELPGQTRLPLL